VVSGRALLAAIAVPVAVLIITIGGIATIFGGGSAAACTIPAASASLAPSAMVTSPPLGQALTTQGYPHSVPPSSTITPASPYPASTLAPGARATAAPPLTPGTAGFDQEQVTNAATIIATGAQLGVPLRGWIITVATAIQESSLRNLRHGDTAGPDSLGLFQQRDSWGTQAARLNPTEATRMFYLGGDGGQPGLLDINHWQDMTLTEAAQAVQHSTHPSAYATHEADATSLAAAITGMTTDAAGLPGGFAITACAQPAGPAAAQAVAFARQQIGVPYQWGGNGPADGGWDCSGLTTAAYAAAGITLPRTAQTQYDAGPYLAPGADLLPGDLVFFGASPAHITHVGIYAGDGNMIDAPHQGAAVRVENFRWATYLGATRPGASDVPGSPDA
jgi:cell wall-associated NlpC family hydrolase